MGHSNPSVNQSTIGAIETLYAGCRFRSRLEARWAVLFDELGIKWEYEPQGFQQMINGRLVRWLPDFYLPATKTWVEVKGSDEQLHRDFDRIMDMCDFSSPVPGMRESLGDGARGLLLLGPIPRVDRTWHAWHPLLQHHEGLTVAACVLLPGEIFVYDSEHVSIDPYWSKDEDQLYALKLEHSMQQPFIPGIHESTAAYIAARSARFEHGE